MRDLIDVFQAIRAGDRQYHLNTIEHCDARLTADEGIPTVIALDDLTGSSKNDVFEPADADRDIAILLAVEAMIYSSMYEKKLVNETGKYPAICHAVSAGLESCFRVKHGDKGEMIVLQYKDEIENGDLLQTGGECQP